MSASLAAPKEQPYQHAEVPNTNAQQWAFSSAVALHVLWLLGVVWPDAENGYAHLQALLALARLAPAATLLGQLWYEQVVPAPFAALEAPMKQQQTLMVITAVCAARAATYWTSLPAFALATAGELLLLAATALQLWHTNGPAAVPVPTLLAQLAGALLPFACLALGRLLHSCVQSLPATPWPHAHARQQHAIGRPTADELDQAFQQLLKATPVYSSLICSSSPDLLRAVEAAASKHLTPVNLGGLSDTAVPLAASAGSAQEEYAKARSTGSSDFPPSDGTTSVDPADYAAFGAGAVVAGCCTHGAGSGAGPSSGGGDAAPGLSVVAPPPASAADPSLELAGSTPSGAFELACHLVAQGCHTYQSQARRMCVSVKIPGREPEELQEGWDSRLQSSAQSAAIMVLYAYARRGCIQISMDVMHLHQDNVAATAAAAAAAGGHLLGGDVLRRTLPAALPFQLMGPSAAQAVVAMLDRNVLKGVRSIGLQIDSMLTVLTAMPPLQRPAGSGSSTFGTSSSSGSGTAVNRILSVRALAADVVASQAVGGGGGAQAVAFTAALPVDVEVPHVRVHSVVVCSRQRRSSAEGLAPVRVTCSWQEPPLDVGVRCGGAEAEGGGGGDVGQQASCLKLLARQQGTYLKLLAHAAAQPKWANNSSSSGGGGGGGGIGVRTTAADAPAGQVQAPARASSLEQQQQQQQAGKAALRTLVRVVQVTPLYHEGLVFLELMDDPAAEAADEGASGNARRFARASELSWAGVGQAAPLLVTHSFEIAQELEQLACVVPSEELRSLVVDFGTFIECCAGAAGGAGGAALTRGSLDTAGEAALDRLANAMGANLLSYFVARGLPACAIRILDGLCGAPLRRVPAELAGPSWQGGMTLLHMAVRSGSGRCVAAVVAWMDAHGCNVDWRAAPKGGVTPLQLAAALPPSGAPLDLGLAALACLRWPTAAAAWRAPPPAHAAQGSPAQLAAERRQPALSQGVAFLAATLISAPLSRSAAAARRLLPAGAGAGVHGRGPPPASWALATSAVASACAFDLPPLEAEYARAALPRSTLLDRIYIVLLAVLSATQAAKLGAVAFGATHAPALLLLASRAVLLWPLGSVLDSPQARERRMMALELVRMATFWAVSCGLMAYPSSWRALVVLKLDALVIIFLKAFHEQMRVGPSVVIRLLSVIGEVPMGALIMGAPWYLYVPRSLACNGVALLLAVAIQCMMRYQFLRTALQRRAPW